MGGAFGNGNLFCVLSTSISLLARKSFFSLEQATCDIDKNQPKTFFMFHCFKKIILGIVFPGSK
jgi:hypothetical protein